VEIFGLVAALTAAIDPSQDRVLVVLVALATLRVSAPTRLRFLAVALDARACDTALKEATITAGPHSRKQKAKLKSPQAVCINTIKLCFQTQVRKI
jgi:hypothetical protein